MNATLEPQDGRPYRMAVDHEPLPGYRLLRPLGRGGFGEVWLCEAPGGLHKAIKFVFAEEDEVGPEGHCLRQEFDAFQQIKAIRHPFLLTLERVELGDAALVMVMELADEHLMDRFNACRTAGQFGIPRDGLLGFMADAAEALDFMSGKYGLQHLDVKPANLFVVAEHAKVGDYGLVAQLQGDGPPRTDRGLTPRYSAPEVVRGEVDPRSDQYSLALVYQEMLTGTFAFQAKSVAHMLFLHATGEPNLSGLPVADRPAVLRALAKSPADRFPSCSAFVHDLMGGSGRSAEPDRANLTRTPSSQLITPGQLGQPTLAPADTAISGTGEFVALTPAAIPAAPHKAPGTGSGPAVALTAEAVLGGPITRLTDIRLVLPVGRLTGEEVSHSFAPSVPEFATAVVTAMCGPGEVLPKPQDVRPMPDGSWLARFPIRPMAGMIRVKLDIFRELWNAEILEPDPATFVVRRQVEAGGVFGGWLAKKGAIEVTIRLPTASVPVGEVEVVAGTTGQVEPQIANCLPGMVDEVRKLLQNFDDRRRHERIRTDTPVTIYPVHRDGVLPAVAGQCVSVSVGGVTCISAKPLDIAYAYVAFDAVSAVAGWAVLTRFLRHKHIDGRFLAAGRFRTEF